MRSLCVSKPALLAHQQSTETPHDFSGDIRKSIDSVRFQVEFWNSDPVRVTSAPSSPRLACATLRETIEKRPTHEVLREHLDALPWPEFRLLAAYITGHETPAVSFWREAVGDEIEIAPDESQP